MSASNRPKRGGLGAASQGAVVSKTFAANSDAPTDEYAASGLTADDMKRALVSPSNGTK